ncbi:hypothetical protein Tco_1551269 [Tanacetum coccineum]
MTDSQSPGEEVIRVIQEFKVTGPHLWSVASFPPDNGHPSTILVSQIGNTFERESPGSETSMLITKGVSWLPTRINLSLRGIDIPSILCPICSCVGESSSHLLFSCNVARFLLLKVARWWELDIQECMSYADWLSWFNALRLSKGIKRVLEGVFYVMWWVIWKFRNQLLFESYQPRLELLFDEIVLLSYTWCSSRCKINFDWISWIKCPSSISL